MTDKEYPLYPTLPDAGKVEAQELINKFKSDLIKMAEKVIGNLYCDIVPHIESDSWLNYRSALMDGFRNYDNKVVQGEFDFKVIRQEIFKEYRVELIKDLDQDMVKEIEELKRQVEWFQRCARDR